MEKAPRLQLAKRPVNARKRTMSSTEPEPESGTKGDADTNHAEEKSAPEPALDTRDPVSVVTTNKNKDMPTVETKKSRLDEEGDKVEHAVGEPRGSQPAARFRVGPVRPNTSSFSSNYHRISIRTDYAPDLCKDYNETGFCGFGDSCKFLHDRGDYKAGWELDAEWEEEQRRKLEREHEYDDDNKSAVADSVPVTVPQTACPICKDEYKRPIVESRCGHCFCEACALAHARTSSKCFVCSAPTEGSFKIVKKRA